MIEALISTYIFLHKSERILQLLMVFRFGLPLRSLELRHFTPQRMP